jgi:hypothetical protein
MGVTCPKGQNSIGPFQQYPLPPALEAQNISSPFDVEVGHVTVGDKRMWVNMKVANSEPSPQTGASHVSAQPPTLCHCY